MWNVEIGTEVTLNGSERSIAKGIATARYNACRDQNIKNSKIGDQSNEQTDLEGFGAELAFCKLHNIYPDLLIKPRHTEDDDGDCSLHIVNGLVDVKATKYETGRLIAPKWKNQDTVDLYALMTGTFPTYTFKGFMTSKEFIRDGRIGDIGRGNITYIATQDELVELKDLI